MVLTVLITDLTTIASGLLTLAYTTNLLAEGEEHHSFREPLLSDTRLCPGPIVLCDRGYGKPAEYYA